MITDALEEPGRYTHRLVPSREGRQNLLSAQEAEAAVLPSLVTLSVWPEISPDTSHGFVFFTQSISSTKSFYIVTSDLYLAFFVLCRDLCVFCCVCRIKFSPNGAVLK